MKKASSLPYYPRFIFSCSDGRGYSTADTDCLYHIKDADDKYENDITQFVPGQRIKINWADEGENLYKVNRVEIHQIKYDLDEPTTGANENDVSVVDGVEKKWPMEIYVLLDLIK